jgi:predicted dinucleotide-binding enzyme
MKVGVIGSGDVAKVLAGGFPKHGHEVMMGTRAPPPAMGECLANRLCLAVYVGYRSQAIRA